MSKIKVAAPLIGLPFFAVSFRDYRRLFPAEERNHSSVDDILSSPLFCLKTRFFHAIRPIVFSLDPETAHSLAITTGRVIAPLYTVLTALERKTESLLELVANIIVGPSSIPLSETRPSRLSNTVCGINFTLPCGIAAGFDKNGKLIHLFNSGLLSAGHAEIGSVSYGPWKGNPKPRLFRLVPDKAIINRMGLNNEGAAEVASRLSHTRSDSHSNEVHVGINITKTPDPKIEGKDAVEDFLQSFKFMQYLDSVKWVTLNISCPNTAEGKTFEDLSALTHLVSTLTAQASDKKLFLKLSPLQDSDNKTEIIQIAKKFQIDALIVANTVPDRNFALKSDQSIIQQRGGLSGPPILERSIPLIQQGFKSGIPVIGVGGVSSGKDAYRLIRNGASLIQLYTAIVYNGPFVFEDIHKGLERCLLIDGIENVSQVIGVDVV